MTSLKQVSMAASLCATMVVTAAPSWATLYTFTFSGSDLVDYVLGNAAAGTTAADAGVYDGALMITSASSGKKYGSWQAGNELLFDTLKYSSIRLTEFNFWGYGDLTNKYGTATASAFGEAFTAAISAWSNVSVAGGSWVWDNTVNTTGTLGKTVLGFGSATGYTDGISFSGLSTLQFTFTLDLDPLTTPWLNGEEGQLVFWYGGYLDALVSNSTVVNYGLLQGNLTLQGVAAVPEPTTMLLFGVGLAGLTGLGRRRVHQSA